MSWPKDLCMHQCRHCVADGSKGFWSHEAVDEFSKRPLECKQPENQSCPVHRSA